MKKIILLVAAISMATFSVNAQKGWFVGGSIGGEFNTTTTTIGGHDDDVKSSNFSIVPSINKMFGEKWSVGLGLGYAYSKFENEETQGEFVLMPNLTYYMQLSDKFYYTPSLNIGLGFGKYNFEDEDVDALDVFEFGANIRPLSFEFRPTEGIGINFAAGSLGYTSATAKINDTKQTNSDFSFGFNQAATVTFKFFF